VLATVALVLIGLGLLAMVSFTSGTAQGFVARLVSSALSSPSSTVSLGKIEGLFSSALTIRYVTVADRDGTWLDVDRVRVVWDPLALLRLRLDIAALEIDRVRVPRKPLTDDAGGSASEPFELPRLPVAVEVEQFSLASLATGVSVLGMPATFSAKGSARVGLSRGLGLVLDVTRQDRPGTLAANLDFVPDGKALRASLHLDEAAGGILAEVADLPGRPPVTLSIEGDGTLDAFRATLAFHAGSAIGVEGKLALDRRGAARNLALELAARLPWVSIERLEVKAAALSKETDPGRSGVLELRAEAEAHGLGFAEAGLAEAIGKEIHLSLQGAGTILGPVDVARLEMTSPSVSAVYKGRLSAGDVTGHLDLEPTDLARFAALAGLGLKGEAKLSADVAALPSGKRFAATIDGSARRLATGRPEIDGLTGGEARLTGSIRYDSEAGFGAENLSLEARHASVRLDGTASAKAADITAVMTVPYLEKADKRLSGRGEAQAHVTGTLEHPDATLAARIDDGTLLGRAVPSLALQARGTDLLGPFDAEAHLDGTIGGKTSKGSLHATRSTNGEIRLDPLQLAVGSVAVTGAGTVDPAFLVSGKLSVHARDLDDLSPVVLEKLAGALDADVTLERDGERQDVALAAKGERIAGFGMGLERLAADLAVSDLYRHPAVSGTIEVREARVASEVIGRLRLEAKGTPQASDVTLSATARGVDLDARGRVIPAEVMRVDLTKLDASRGRTRIGLAGPATVTIEDKAATIRNLALVSTGGRLSIDGRAGPSSDLKIVIRAVPLSIADLLAPDLGLGGTLDGEANVAGAPGALSGSYRLRATNVVTAQSRTAGLPPISGEAKGRLEGTKTAVDAKLAAAEAGRLDIAGTAPLAPGGALDLGVKGNLDVGVAGRMLAASGRRVSGAVAIDGRVTGTLDRPRAAGSVNLANGSYQDAVSGTRLDAIRARLVARDDRVVIESASATARNGGTITASGDVRLDPAGGFPGSVRIFGKQAEVVRSSDTMAVVDLDLAVTGPLARTPRLGGRVAIETLDIAIAEQQPDAARPLAGTRHIRPTATAEQRLSLAAEAKWQKGAPFDATLDVTVDVHGRIRVTGRGLDAELGGSLKVQGSLEEPKPVGAFHLVRGKMQILTTQLDFARANLTFAGDLSPQLDFLGTTQAGGASIRVAITGSPSEPRFTFSSSPDYPQDEILSRLLFGQASGRLTPTQALALTQAIAIYSGGTSALESLRRSLGLGAASRSSNPLTNWLGDRMSLGIRTGATPGQTGVGVDLSIWKQLKARGAIDARGAASVGVGAETEW
jgi:translocation and assembly module TamB